MKNWRRRAYQIGQAYGFASGWPTNKQALLFAIKRASGGLPSRQAAIAVRLARLGYREGAHAFTEESEHTGFCSGCGLRHESGESYCGACGRQARALLLRSQGVTRLQEVSAGHVLNRQVERAQQRRRVPTTSASNLVMSGATRQSGLRGHTYHKH